LQFENKWLIRVLISWCSSLSKNKPDNILHLAFSPSKSHSISNLLNLSPEEKIRFEQSALRESLFFKNL